MGIQLHHNTQVGNFDRNGMSLEQVRDNKDRTSLYIDDWSTPGWEPMDHTIADMTTVLVIQGPFLLCRKSGVLSVQSHFKPADLYSHLDPETRPQIMTTGTPRIPVYRGNYPVRKTPTYYRPGINPQPTNYDPTDLRFFELLSRAEHGSDSEPIDLEENKRQTQEWEKIHGVKMFPIYPPVPLPSSS